MDGSALRMANRVSPGLIGAAMPRSMSEFPGMSVSPQTTLGGAGTVPALPNLGATRLAATGGETDQDLPYCPSNPCTTP